MGGHTNARWRRRLLVLLLLLAFAIFWCGAGAAWVLAIVADRLGPMLTARRTVQVVSVAWNGDFGRAEPDQKAGVLLTMSPGRARQLVNELAGPWRFFLPPRALQQGLLISGVWTFRHPKDCPPLRFPVTVRLDDRSAYPTLRGRFPRSRLNEMVRREGFLGDRRDRSEYALGHYVLRNEYRFSSLKIQCEPPRRQPVTHRIVHVYVKGRVRYWFDENLVSARATAEVKPSHLRVEIDASRLLDGISVRYRATFIEFDANFNRMMPVLDGMFTDKLRNSLEASLNRQRKVDRTARKRLPLWSPLDLMLDVELDED
jgi:hypothetical protein